jgi:hypothetical protein
LRKTHLVLWPAGHLLFIVGVAVLSAAAVLLGDEHELGFFTRRLAFPIWRCEEVTRRGRQLLWLLWTAATGVAIFATPTRWDEVGLTAIAACCWLLRLRRSHGRDARPAAGSGS